MFFTDLKETLNKAINLDYDEAFVASVNERVKREIIRLNTEEQLFKRGIDSLGVSLGIYSDFTIPKKQADNLPFGHVTLFQEGDFYKSFRVFLDSSLNIIIEADGAEKDDKDLRDVYGEDIIGLTDEHLQIIINMIAENIQEFVRQKITYRGRVLY